MGSLTVPYKTLLLDLDQVLVDTRGLESLRESTDAGAIGRAMASKGIAAFDGVKDALEAVARRGTRLGVVSTTSRAFGEAVLSHTLPWLPIPVAVFEDDVTRSAPYPDGIEEALARTAAEPHEVAYVTADDRAVEAAYHAGVHPLRATWGAEHWDSVPGGFRSSPFRDPFDWWPSELVVADEGPFPEAIVRLPEQLINCVTEPDRALPALEQLEYSGARVLPFQRSVDGRAFAGVALGRYFARKGPTLDLHLKHGLSSSIYAREGTAGAWRVPRRWPSRLSSFLAAMAAGFGATVVAGVPDRAGRPGRMTQLLVDLRTQLHDDGVPVRVEDSALQWRGATSDTRLMGKDERIYVAKDSLEGGISVHGEVVVLLDEVVTTGATLAQGIGILSRAGAKRVLPAAIAGTVSGHVFKTDLIERQCPRCGRDMELRLHSYRQDRILGCSNLKCDYVEPIA